MDLTGSFFLKVREYKPTATQAGPLYYKQKAQQYQRSLISQVSHVEGKLRDIATHQ
jgi:hypothetical protein